MDDSSRLVEGAFGDIAHSDAAVKIVEHMQMQLASHPSWSWKEVVEYMTNEQDDWLSRADIGPQELEQLAHVAEYYQK